ncbi:LOW QUALITY PROTEIN: Multidrug resistance protein ABC Superfamily [Phytophthora palmivora]|uniref:Multidrug resistance protein ABC Superfamily n=1 Tax=Phytophthora palmivora TaxID=4796 RepID=A0A2P4Y031_9STRA|nr:LOW QUALITY PROTEIN: Multidrug resistance protein ABC Superfamily [Phytophthora palmivora]
MGTPLKYTNEGIPKNWDGRDWQTHKWAIKIVFREKGLEDIAEGKLQKAALSDAETEDEFDQKETKILHMEILGTSVPPELLHQIRDKTTGSEMAALCDLFGNKDNKTVKAHTIRRLRDDRWNIKFSPGGIDLSAQIAQAVLIPN